MKVHATDQSPDTKTVNNITEFEGLRGLMAWWVVLGHMAQFSGYEGNLVGLPWYQYIILRGAVPVQVFVTLSGFVIFMLLYKSPKLTYKPYIIGRFFRLYPAYLIAFVFALASMPLVSTAIHSQWGNVNSISEISNRLLSTEKNIYSHIGLHLTLLHGLVSDQLLPYAGEAIIGPAWSLSLEWQFYLVAPLLAMLCLRSFSGWVITCCFIILLKLWVIRSEYTFSYGAFLPMHFEFFMLGMGSFIAWSRAIKLKLVSAAMKPLLVGLTLGFLVMLLTGGMREHFFPVSIWLSVYFIALRRAVHNKTTLFSRVLNLPTLQFIGRISYSTYIIHISVITCLGYVLVKFLGDFINTSTEAFASMVVAGLPLIFIASILLNRWIELPGMRLGKKVCNQFWPSGSR